MIEVDNRDLISYPYGVKPDIIEVVVPDPSPDSTPDLVTGS